MSSINKKELVDAIFERANALKSEDASTRENTKSTKENIEKKKEIKIVLTGYALCRCRMIRSITAVAVVAASVWK